MSAMITEHYYTLADPHREVAMVRLPSGCFAFRFETMDNPETRVLVRLTPEATEALLSLLLEFGPSRAEDR